MKGIILFPVLAVLIIATSCRKPTTTTTGPSHTGRIINSICGQITVQFTDGSSLGQNGWVDKGTTYNHVFAIADPCNWNESGIIPGDTIRFTIVPPKVQNCVLCMAIGHIPDTAYSIEYQP